MNEEILKIIEDSKSSHNNKNSLFLEKYLGYYNLQVQGDIILYESFNGQGMIDNPYGIFKELYHNHKYDKYDGYSNLKHVWVLDNFDVNWYVIMEYPDVTFVKYGSDEYLYYLSVAKYLINNCTFPTYFIKKDNQIYVNTWHGIPIKKLGYDVPNSNFMLGNTMRNFLSANYMISANDFMTEVYNKSYKLENIYDGKILTCGLPRCEVTISRQKVIEKLNSFGVNINPNKKVILYAPTWSGDLSNPKEIDYQKVFKCVDTSKYQILYKPHHVNYRKKPEFIPPAMDTNELLSITDVLITDYSSIAFDFMEYHKPIIFYIDYKSDYKKTHGIYFDWDNKNVVTNTDTLKVYLSNVDRIRPIKPRKEYMIVHDTDTIIEHIFNDTNKLNNNKLNNDNHKKTRLLFYVGDFKPNGVTTSFLSLSNNIDYNKYDVTLIALTKKDALYQKFINNLNPNIRVLARAGTYAQTLLEECSKNITLQKGIGTDYLYNLLPKEMYKREFKRCFGLTQFDKLINFTGYSPFYSYFFMNANGEKIVWLHNDMIQDQNRIVDDKKPLYQTLATVFTTYPYYDKLISASKEIMDVNIKSFPDGNHYYAHNTLDYEKILKLSNISNGTELGDGIHFINNGRLSYAKNQKELILAFNEFSSIHPECHLWIIGGGELESELKSVASENVHILGYQENPYYTMKQGDYFIFPSLYEGQGISLLEARVLGLPIIVSDLPKMKGIFLKGGQYNIHGFDKEAILRGLNMAYKKKVHKKKFDYKQYNLESYKEFEDAICE